METLQVAECREADGRPPQARQAAASRRDGGGRRPDGDRVSKNPACTGSANSCCDAGPWCVEHPRVRGEHQRHSSNPQSAGQRRLLLVTALDSRPLQQLAVLLLRHALTTLLDDRAHGNPRSRVHTDDPACAERTDRPSQARGRIPLRGAESARTSGPSLLAVPGHPEMRSPRTCESAVRPLSTAVPGRTSCQAGARGRPTAVLRSCRAPTRRYAVSTYESRK